MKRYNKTIGGIRFIRFGRLCLTFSKARPRVKVTRDEFKPLVRVMHKRLRPTV